MNRNRRNKMRASFQPRHMRAARAAFLAALDSLALVVRRMAAGFREAGKTLGLAQQRDHYALSSTITHHPEGDRR